MIDLTYELLSYDPNAMSKWLPPIAEQVKEYNFFKIPKTKILKVPMTLLQSTRTATYNELSPISIEIINRYIYRVFGLDDKKDYFIKTGTFSSKFDFRNAKVTAGQEVKELGSYLWYIQHQASQMASMLNNVCLYGVSTNNEWIVREFIDDAEDNPTIYNGLPLHTEYRVFVDFDTKEVIGINPYWDPEVMKKNFLEVGSSAQSQPKSNDSQSNSNTPKAKQPNAIYDPSKNARQSSSSQNNSYVQKPSLAPPTLPIESWNSYSNRSYYQPIENNFTYPTLTQQLLFMNLLNNRNHNNYYYYDNYYYDDYDYTTSERKDEESDDAEKQKPYMIFVFVLLLVLGVGFFALILS